MSECLYPRNMFAKYLVGHFCKCEEGCGDGEGKCVTSLLVRKVKFVCGERETIEACRGNIRFTLMKNVNKLGVLVRVKVSCDGWQCQ